MTHDQLTYAGDITPEDTWQRLRDDPHAVLIDVRTPEEWAYVGIVDMTEVKRDAVFVPWLHFPRMTRNPNFVAEVLNAAKMEDKDTPLLFICRSGHRSAYAADALTKIGYIQCYNVACGFEGDQDARRHRGTVNGWKNAGLPWVQG